MGRTAFIHVIWHVYNENGETTMIQKQVHLGGIVKTTKGIGFKISFQTREEAQIYKETIKRWFEKTLGYNVENTVGYHDKEARQ